MGTESTVAAIIWDAQSWAHREFGECQLGDRRRNKRLMKLAVQVAARPDGGTPDQTETWSDLKAAYRLFDAEDVSFQAIIEPHCRHTRETCRPGDEKLIINDTTELDFTSHHKTRGLGPIGNGFGRGFFIHSGLMVDAHSGRTDGMAGQEIFYRIPKGTKRGAKNTRRRDPNRESAVWGRLIDHIGPPPLGVEWTHVCDRGADDYEVFLRARRNHCGFVIRAAKLHRLVQTDDGRTLTLQAILDQLPICGERDIAVKATTKQPARKATVALRFTEIVMPPPRVINAWIREHMPKEPLRVRVVELREISPPNGCQPVRWVLYATQAVQGVADAEQVIGHYEQRPTIEDYHKCYKTGCRVEKRQYETAERLERVAGLLSIVAVRLLQMRTAARETPERPAHEVAPRKWVEILRVVRKIPASRELTIRDFVRQLGGLGGHMLRKRDGEPGWITLWRGYEKLQLLLRGADALPLKCG
jgi:hypothetical protein